MTSDKWEQRPSGSKAHCDDPRSPYEKDYARIVHSSSFRRLQGKTQILSLGDNDFYRTRLTHSIEVAQIAEGIVQQFRRSASGAIGPMLPPACLAQAIGLAHDLGHPPFGHGGEYALNFCMRDANGFEGNAHTLRLLTRLEAFTPEHGADLTRRALLGVLKYPVLRSAALGSVEPAVKAGSATISVLDRDTCKPPKAYFDEDADIVEWILEPFSQADRELFRTLKPGKGKGAHLKPVYKSFDCSIMDLADDIAYGVHDLEDAITLGLIDRDLFDARIGSGIFTALIASLAARPLDRFPSTRDGFVDALFGSTTDRKRAIGRLVHFFILNARVEEDAGFEAPLLRHRVRVPVEAGLLLKALKEFVADEVIRSPRVQHLEFKGQRMVVAVFEALASDPGHLLPVEVFARFEADGGSNRAICDHVASMTDGALLKTYERLFSPRMGSVFDRL